MKITELSIKRPTLVVVFFSALLVLGMVSYYNLSYELIPKISAPIVSIVTIYPGASPDEVETSVTEKIEDAVSGIDNVKKVSATTMEGVSAVAVEFNSTAKLDFALQDVQRKVNEILSDLPDDARTPTVSKIALDEQPIIRAAIRSTMPSREFYTLLTDQIKPELAKIKGVAQIDFIGGEQREIKVNLDSQKLRSYGLSAARVAQMLHVSNLEFPTGTLKDRDEQYIVRIAGKISDIDVLKNLIVGQSKTGGDICLADIADIEDGREEITQAARLNGLTAVGMFIKKQSDANAVEVGDGIKAALVELESKYSDIQLKFDIAQDATDFTTASANAVKEDLLIAVILVALVMLLFLHNLSNSLIVLITIPTSLISAFIVSYALNFSLNVVTLLAMSTVIGILVDDAIIIIENIFRHMEQGESRREASLTALKEIALAAIAIVLVIIVVMAPLILVRGTVAVVFKQFAIVVISATALSLLVSFTLTPMLSSRFMQLGKLKSTTVNGRIALRFEKIYSNVAQRYKSILDWSLANPRKILLAWLFIFILVVLLIPLGFVGTEFISPTDQNIINMTIEASPGTKFQDMYQLTCDVERKLAEVPEVTQIFSTVGISSNILSSQSANNIASLTISVIDKNDRDKKQAELEQLVREVTSNIPGVRVTINSETLGMSGGAPIQVLLTGTNRDDVLAASEIVEDIVRGIPGTADVQLSSEEGKPEMRVDIDRDKMANLGLSLAEVGSVLRIALTGDDDTKFKDGSNQYNIRVLFDEYDRQKTDELGNISFVNHRGQQIQLKQFADIYRSTGPSKLERTDRNACVTVNAEAAGRGSGTISQDIDAILKKTDLPPGVSYQFEGHTDLQKEAFGNLFASFAAAILFIYLILVALFDSYIYPLAVLFSIPGALIGAILMLALTMSTLNLFSVLGMLMMIGLVAKDSILVVDRTNQIRKNKSLDVIEALKEAAASRFRPILMTTTTMVFGMLPIALAANPGSELKTGMGWAIIGGLLSSLVITLVLIPVVYVVIDKIKVKIENAFKSQKSLEIIEVANVEVKQ